MRGLAGLHCQGFEVERPSLGRELTITLSRLATSDWTPSWIAPIVRSQCRGGWLQILRRRRVQLADALIDLDEFGATLLEAAEGGHLALGLAGLGGLGERLLDGLALALEGEADLGPRPGWSSLVQEQFGLPQRRKAA